MTQTKSSPVFVLVAQVLFTVLFVFFMYTFLHEVGHAMIGLLFGQSLSELNIHFWDFTAHVELTGGALTPSQLAGRAVAGVGLPFLLWALFMSRMPRRVNFMLEILKLISSMAVINTLLPWIILPILFLFGKAPSDDVTNFLHYSQIAPLLLAFIALLVYGAAWILFLSKINGLRNEFLLFKFVDRKAIIAGAHKPITVLFSIMIFCVALTFTINQLAGKNHVNQFSPPSDFVSVAAIDLSSRPYSAETLASFEVEQPALASVFLVIHDINTTYFDLRVTGPNEFNSIVLHGEGYRVAIDGGLWQHNLMPGTYQLVLTSHQSSGTASVYLPKQK